MNRWRSVRYGVGLEMAVPDKPGVYVIGRAIRILGLPVQVDVIYAGQSNNLRRRWSQHADLREPNRGLNGVAERGTFEFWWLRLPLDELDQIEGELIERLQPMANRRRRRAVHLPRDDCCAVICR